MKIINLITWAEITPDNQPAGPVMAMFIHSTDESGAPLVYEIKTYFP